jgi:hypothetical protein
VPTIAGILAFWAAVPTEPPTFPTVDPTEVPTPLSAPVTPFAEGFEFRDLELCGDDRRAADVGRDPLLDVFLRAAVERGLFADDFLPAERLAGLRVPDLVRPELREPEARRVVGAAISCPLSLVAESCAGTRTQVQVV